jgi:excisionase family DNA binding protein
MMQYLSLEEAAHVLGVTPDELKQMAEDKRVRLFRDRGSMRFRAQEIEELARQLGRRSDPELPIGEAPPPKSGDTPPRQKVDKKDPDVFDFVLSPEDSDQVEIGQEMAPQPGSKSKAGPPTPKPGSDSDVRLVADGSDLDFQVATDSKIRTEDSGTKSAQRKTQAKPPDPQPDSGVRLLPPDESAHDSDVRIMPESEQDSDIIMTSQFPKKGSDSDIRLAPDQGSPSGSSLNRPPLAPDESHVTEEIDLDVEQRKKKGDSSGKQKGPKTKSTVKPKPAEPPSSQGSADANLKKPKKKDDLDSSSDFELKPAKEDSSDEFRMDSAPELEIPSDEEVVLGDLTKKEGDSGINLQDPADSGISLEHTGQEEEALDFELSAEAGSTPKPGPVTKEEDSDSEFELSLDSSVTASGKNLAEKSDSDSEFELTLDDSGDLLPLDSDSKGADSAAGQEESDIFETDFEVPALGEDSGSQASGLEESDTDLESSDFDLALGDEDAAAEEESGSQVVALEDEEEADASAETTTRPRHRRAAVEDEDIDELLGEEDLEGEEVEVGAPAEAYAKPQKWGLLEVIPMGVCVFVMFFVMLMGLELMRGMWGYHQSSKVSGSITHGLAEMLSLDVPKD